MFPLATNVVSVIFIMATIHRHYPVNRYLVIFHLLALSVFIQFVYEPANATIVERVNKMSLLFFGAKLLFDFVVWMTGSQIV